MANHKAQSLVGKMDLHLFLEMYVYLRLSACATHMHMIHKEYVHACASKLVMLHYDYRRTLYASLLVISSRFLETFSWCSDILIAKSVSG